MIPLLRQFLIQRQVNLAPASFECRCFRIRVGDEVFEATQQEGTEAAASLVNPTQCSVLN